jgi:hypothetical protein
MSMSCRRATSSASASARFIATVCVSTLSKAIGRDRSQYFHPDVLPGTTSPARQRPPTTAYSVGRSLATHESATS